MEKIQKKALSEFKFGYQLSSLELFPPGMR